MAPLPPAPAGRTEDGISRRDRGRHQQAGQRTPPAGGLGLSASCCPRSVRVQLCCSRSADRVPQTRHLFWIWISAPACVRARACVAVLSVRGRLCWSGPSQAGVDQPQEGELSSQVGSRPDLEMTQRVSRTQTGGLEEDLDLDRKDKEFKSRSWFSRQPMRRSPDC